MTIGTAHQEFKVLYDKTDSLNYPNFLPEEIDIFLNNAIERFVSQRLYGNNPRREGVDETQKRVDDLKDLYRNHSTTTFTQNSDSKDNGYFVSLPSDYRHALEEEVGITYTDCNSVTGTDTIPVVPTTYDRYNKIKRDPFNKPNRNKVLRLGFSRSNSLDRFELIADSDITLNTYYLRYIKEPTPVQLGSQYATPIADVDPEFSENYIMKEIIKMAVTEALGNNAEGINSQRVLINKQQSDTIE